MNNLIFKSRDELIQVNPDEIVYFKADGNYSKMILSSGKEKLLTMNLTKVQMILDEQLGNQSALFERVGRDVIIRKAYLFTIQVLRKRLILTVPNCEKYFELSVSKEALKKLKEDHENMHIFFSPRAQLRDLQTRNIYPLKTGLNRFGRKSNSTACDNQIDNGDNQISRLHFEIDVRQIDSTINYEYSLTDSQSANGTYLNNERIETGVTVLLSFGDKIRVGKTKLMLENIDIDRTEII